MPDSLLNISNKIYYCSATVSKFLCSEHGENNLRRVARCAEMVQKAATKIILASNCGDSQSPTGSPSSSCSQSEVDTVTDSLLNESQVEEMDFAVQEVKLSVSSLADHLKRALESEMVNSPGGRNRRVLPLSPHDRTGMASPRKLGNRINAARNLNLVDLVETS